jgi:hypothetical protein
VVFYVLYLYLKFVSVGSFWILLLFLFSGVSCFAHDPAEGRIFGTFGPFFYHTQSIYAPDGPYTPFPTVGGGLLGEGDLGPKGGIEMGIFYYRKSYDRTLGISNVVSKIDKVEIPMGYRYWPTHNLSAALEFSSAFSVGDPQIVYSSVPPGGDQNTMANTLTEYDAVVSVQWEFWNNDRFALVLDGRYNYALNANLGEDANQFGALIGLKYEIQVKKEEEHNDQDTQKLIKPIK